LAGMSCAYYLKLADPEARVVVVEADLVGEGASGRHAGNVANLGRSYLSSLIKRLGPEAARFVVSHQQRMLDDFEALLLNEDIQCDYLRSDLLLVGMTENVVSGMKRLHELQNAYGLESRYFDAEEANRCVNL